MVPRQRDSETAKESETDIFLVFRDLSTNKRCALHIENKPAHGKWRPGQPENYQKRAENRMEPWRYVAFQTILLAPQSFIARNPTEAAHFDLVFSYEEVGAFVDEFAIEANALIRHKSK